MDIARLSKTIRPLVAIALFLTLLGCSSRESRELADDLSQDQVLRSDLGVRGYEPVDDIWTGVDPLSELATVGRAWTGPIAPVQHAWISRATEAGWSKLAVRCRPGGFTLTGERRIGDRYASLDVSVYPKGTLNWVEAEVSAETYGGRTPRSTPFDPHEQCD